MAAFIARTRRAKVEKIIAEKPRESPVGEIREALERKQS